MSIDTIEYFNGPFLKKNKISYRHYQKNIVNRCRNKNSLVILPTGLGKTIIGILQIANCLKKYNSLGKVIILAPTRPLVSQHKASCEKFIDIYKGKITLLTGKIPPEKRMVLFNKSRIIVSTPQVIKNDLMRGRYDLKHVALIIFDEAHRTRGNYAYNFISNEYINSCSDPLILGLTASPGKDYEHIQQLCDNLYVENIIFKTINDHDVKDYIYYVDTFIERVDLSIKLLEICEVWNHLFRKFLRFFVERNLLNAYKKYYSKLDFLRISHDLTYSLKYENSHDSQIFNDDLLAQLYYQSPKIIDFVKENKLNIQSIFSYCSSCISILHAKDLLETQDIMLFKSFLEKIQSKADRDILSAKRIVKSKHYNFIKSSIEKEDQSNLSHPKISKLFTIIREEIEEFQNKKIIIFTQYREMAELLKNKLDQKFSDELIVEKFIGQTTKIDDCGFTQHKQIETLQEFREGKINILIATSVAEEGLDIPNVDAIIFYEPVPSEIRLIQRRGRTGRFAPGRCYILLTENTVDVPFHIVAKKKENTMNSILMEPEQLELNKSLKRKKIEFSTDTNNFSKLDIFKNFKEHREKEKEILANRSIEKIITEIDNFSKSSEYKKLKNYGVSFITDLIRINESKLRKNVLKIKGKKSINSKERKFYLNKKIKTLINIAKLNENGKIKLSKFQDLARGEDLFDKKFYFYFNQACNLGYLKKQADYVQCIKDYD
ncbi:MAG: DEAD/DEAH box helicase [Candidatus Hodarchaeota archaeon]